MGVSSDGDPKLLSAMKYHMKYHFENQDRKFCVVQDTTHIGTKLRNWLLKPDIVLPMGRIYVSINHLRSLLLNVHKSVHGLNRTDVYPYDRMDVQSFRKIIDDRVIEALQKHVNDSDATIKYLKICFDVTSAFLQLDLAPLDRIFRIWKALYFLRIWRGYIKASYSYSLADNFISPNAYTCIEINARNLIILIKKFRDEEKPEFFLTTLFDSQTCERAFRQFRSLGTMEYTKINFSLYELLHMIGRIEVMNDIAYVKLADKPISFPNKRTGKTTIYPLPTDEEIDFITSKAKEEAKNDALHFGMNNFDDIEHFQIESKLQLIEFTNNEEEVMQIIDDDADDEDDTDDNYDGENRDTHNEEALQTDELTGDENDLGENSAFIFVTDENNKKCLIRKSTYLWMLQDSSFKLSNDRLRRFRAPRK